VEEVDRPNIGGIHVCARCRRSVASHDAHEPGSLSHARSERSGPRRNGRFARGKEHGSPRACVLGGRLYALTAAHANDGGALSWRRGAAHRRGRRRFPAARDRLPALIRARPRRENRPSLMVTPRRRGRPKRTLLQLRLRAFSCSSITCGVPLFRCNAPRNRRFAGRTPILAPHRAPPRGKPGRQAVDRQLRELVVRLARENPRWSYPRIAGELREARPVCLSPSTVRRQLLRAGLEPAPRRSGPNWTAASGGLHE
jgi:hypothetical protein